MKRRYNIFYFISEALKGLKRNGVMTFASIAVLLSCLLVMGGFSLLVLNINVNLERLGTLNEIVAYCNSDADAEKISEIEGAIKSLDNVDTVIHVTKAEALKSLQEKNPELYDDVTEEENPLFDSFTISYKDNSGVNELDYQLHQIDGIYRIRNNIDLANKIESVKSGVMIVFLWFLAILFVVSIFIIINTIKLTLFSRRKEISIMRYIGATGWFITLPFIIEGIIIGVVSGLCSFFVIKFAYGYVIEQAMSFQMLELAAFGPISNYILLACVGIGVATGVIGGGISIAKYLRD